MGTPFLAEIKIISWNFAPQGWAFCNGQLLQINQNQALFSILGTTYGGNGQTNFALPDLRGRIPFHVGQGFVLGQRAGEENHTLSMSEMAAHTHQVSGSSGAGTLVFPSTAGASGQHNLWGTTSLNPYASSPSGPPMDPLCVSNTGGSQPHNNMQPFLTLNFIIALIGIFPSRN
jgi:microcystin-dependent protein